MKLNMWQWIGIALLVLCGVLWIYEKNKPDKGTPSTQPTTQRY